MGNYLPQQQNDEGATQARTTNPLGASYGTCTTDEQAHLAAAAHSPATQVGQGQILREEALTRLRRVGGVGVVCMV